MSKKQKPKTCGVCHQAIDQPTHPAVRHMCMPCVNRTNSYSTVFHDVIMDALIYDYYGSSYHNPSITYKDSTDTLWTIENWEEHPLIKLIRNEISCSPAQTPEPICPKCNKPGDHTGMVYYPMDNVCKWL